MKRIIADISGNLRPDNNFRKIVNCSVLDAEAVRRYLSEPIFLNASTAVLVLSGTSVLSANYKLHEIGPNTLILLSASHLFDFRDCSHDFQCTGLFVSRDFTDEMDRHAPKTRILQSSGQVGKTQKKRVPTPVSAPSESIILYKGFLPQFIYIIYYITYKEVLSLSNMAMNIFLLISMLFYYNLFQR